MGRLAAAVAVVGRVLCGALLALMFVANRASKEEHVDGSGVSVDLKGNPVQSKPLQSFGSLIDFPKLDASVLNEMDYVSFSAHQLHPSNCCLVHQLHPSSHKGPLISR
jgi:hypothetical protein